MNTSSSIDTDFNYIENTLKPSNKTRLEKIDELKSKKLEKIRLFTDSKKYFDVIEIKSRRNNMYLRTSFDNINMIVLYQKNGNSLVKETRHLKQINAKVDVFDDGGDPDKRAQVKTTVVLFFSPKTARRLEATSPAPTASNQLLGKSTFEEDWISDTTDYFLYVQDEPISDEDIKDSGGLSDDIKLFLYIGVPIIICVIIMIFVLLCVFCRKKKKPEATKKQPESSSKKIITNVDTTNQMTTGSEREMLNLKSGRQVAIENQSVDSRGMPLQSPMVGAYPAPPVGSEGSGGLPMIPIHNVMAKDSNGNPISVVYVMPSQTASQHHGGSQALSMQSGSNLHSGLPSELPSLTGTLPGSGFTRITQNSGNSGITGFSDGTMPGDKLTNTASQYSAPVGSNNLNMFPVEEMPHEDDEIQMFEVDINEMGEYKPGGKHN